VRGGGGGGWTGWGIYPVSNIARRPVPPPAAVRPGSEGLFKEGVLEGLETGLSRCCAMAASQLQKSGLGPLRACTTFFGEFALVHVYISPLVITFVHGANSNCGTTLDALPELEDALEPVRAQLETYLESVA
jgi:hypothetical protein